MVDAIEITPSEQESQSHANPNYYPVIRTTDGNIAIKMKDGSVRVVTPEQYEQMYKVQNMKRARMIQMMQLRRQQQQSQQVQDNPGE